jgi:cyanophycinase
MVHNENMDKAMGFDAPDAGQQGALFVIGGKEARREDLGVLEHFTDDCGGKSAELIIISTASTEPVEMQAKYEEAFGALGVRKLKFFHQDSRSDAENPELLAAVDGASGLFFTGGNQLKLVTAIAGSSFEAQLKQRYTEGLHIGGTSAGAAAMSTVMIARGTGRASPRLASIRMSPGLGFLSTIIVDQHFHERDRFARLMAAVLCNPAMLGFGLDENTAFVLTAGNRISVIGSGTLTVVDGSDLRESSIHSVAEDMPAGFAGMRLNVLSEGWSFRLADRLPVPPVKDPV